MRERNWTDVGAAAELSETPVRRLEIAGLALALSYHDGAFAALSAVCAQHKGGPLDQGTLVDGCLVCPWHNWKYDRATGRAVGRPAGVDAYDVQVRDGRVLVDVASGRGATTEAAVTHPLERPIVREPGPLRVAGISTTVMNRETPRYSTSERLLGVALDHASSALGAETRLLTLNDLRFRNCEGYYSKSAHSCTWPCTITQADATDEMQQVYEALVFWADVVVVATPIRWGNASSLFYKMAERMNCIQNQITINDKVLIRNKVATFIITGGQDNIQGVAGQLLTFFSEIGFHFPQFPFIAHSRGWDAEDMERNIAIVEESETLREGARQLVGRGLATASLLLGVGEGNATTPRGGRKASPLGGVA